VSVVRPSSGQDQAVWLVSFVARPGPDAEVGAAAEPAAGAFVNVYVVEASSEAAGRVAREGVDEAGWWIEAAEEPQLVDPDSVDGDAVELVEQARADGAVWVFHTWPPGAEDDQGPVPG
jgi:hypothetical protein